MRFASEKSLRMNQDALFCRLLPQFLRQFAFSVGPSH